MQNLLEIGRELLKKMNFKSFVEDKQWRNPPNKNTKEKCFLSFMKNQVHCIFNSINKVHKVIHPLCAKYIRILSLIEVNKSIHKYLLSHIKLKKYCEQCSQNDTPRSHMFCMAKSLFCSGKPQNHLNKI